MVGPEGSPRPASSTTRDGRVHQTAFHVLLTIGAYLLAALWAKHISLGGSVLIWFPPAGVAITACYLRPRLVGAVAVAELISTPVLMGLGAAYGPVALVVNSVGLAAAYAFGGWMLRRLALRPNLRTPEDVAVLSLGVFASSALAAVIGIAVQVWVGLVPTDDVLRSTGLFFVGDVVGAACLVPALIIAGASVLAGERPRLADDEGRIPRWQLGLELLAPAVVALGLMAIEQEPMRFVYLAFIPVVVVAVRHGIGAAAVSTAALSAVMTAGAHAQIPGALDRSDFQLLMLVLTTTGVVTGAAVSARSDLLVATERVSDIVRATPDLVASVSRDGQIRYLNPMGRRLLGFAPGATPEQPAFDFLPDELARGLMREGMRTAESQGAWMGNNHFRRPDGHVFPVSQVLILHPTPDEDGQRIYSTICRDTTVQTELEAQLQRAAFYDDETGLPNRSLLKEHLAFAVGAADRSRRSAVLFADIDHVQRLTETFGFSAASTVTTTIARRIRSAMRAQDLVARHGETQFVVVLADVADEFEAISLAHTLLASFAPPVAAEGHELTVTGSVGVTILDGSVDHHQVLRSAEIALHRAREAGGGRFAMFDADLEVRSQQRRELEADLHEVLTSQAWGLAYQPIFDSRLRRVVAVEALLRWTHPTRGPVAPFELIRLAEESGAIVQLGREIFRRACEEAVRWHDMGFDLPVSINVSARQLHEPSFIADIASVISETGIASDRVVVELTESVIAEDLHGERSTLAAIRELGCRLALDDFGTGYSSLSELRDLPIDIVKLDRSFITDLTTSPRASAMVEAVVRLANALDLQVVAEGVEHDAQIDALAELGCHRVQGFALSRPVAPDVVTGMLSDSRGADRRP